MSEQHYIKRVRRYVPIQDDFAHLRGFDPHTLLIAATRYFLGRMTISTCAHAEELAAAWPNIPESTRIFLRLDIEREFELDDKARARGDDYKPLGMDMDRAAWEKVRAAWGDEERRKF